MSQSQSQSISPELQVIPARKGKAARVKKGQSIRLINTHGKQVVDTWAFNAHDLTERMSMEHTRAHFDKILPRVGDSFVTNRRDPILTIIEDTTPGNHDTLMAACDRHRYVKQFGLKEYHDNCTDNLKNALNELGEQGQEFSPSPFNIFMNIPIKEGQALSWDAPTTEAGQYITFRAEMDLIIAFSACPNDCLPINGGMSMDAHFQIF
jgi:uncharacterized protein YcgI (DUF1989 family)